MTGVFESFVYGDARPGKSELEAAAFETAFHLTSHERTEANDALLAKLDFAKRAAPPHAQHRDLLDDPYISDLANTLLIINIPWIMRTIGGSRRHLKISETAEELFSLAAMGNRGADADVGGVYGVILSYDYQRVGNSSALTQCLQTAIRRAFLPGHKDARKNGVEVIVNGEAESLMAERVDNRERNPASIAIDRDLMDAIRAAIQRMPQRYREIGTFIVDTTLETGELPTQEAIAARFCQHADGTPGTRTRGGQLLHEIVGRLTDNLQTQFPQLAEDGIGGWKELKAAFRKTSEQGQFR